MYCILDSRETVVLTLSYVVSHVFCFSPASLSNARRDTFSEDTKLSKRAIELNNGRAAQMGLLALMVHEKLGVSLIPEV